jgi:hypothetical protein
MTDRCPQTVKVSGIDLRLCEGPVRGHHQSARHLTRAQFQCNFGKYSTAMPEDAKKCAAVVGDAAAKNLLSEGMDIFDWNEQKRGHDEMCRSVLANFAGIVAK